MCVYNIALKSTSRSGLPVQACLVKKNQSSRKVIQSVETGTHSYHILNSTQDAVQRKETLNSIDSILRSLY